MTSELIPLMNEHAALIIAAGAIVGIVVAIQWRKSRELEAELAFKAELLERGVTVEDMERLLLLPPRKESVLKQFAALSGGAKAGLII